MELPGYTDIARPATHPKHVLSSSSGPSNQILVHSQQASGFKSQTVYLNAIPVPLYQLFQPPVQQLAEGQHCSVDRGSAPMILSPIVHSEKTDLAAAVIQKKQDPNLTVNILSTLPILPPGCYSDSSNLSPVKPKNAGKYACKHCGRDCLKPSVLEKHIRSHTGERPFPCITCGIAFKTQSNLYKHRRTQTHVNNTRLSSESDSSILEESEKPLESSVQEYFSTLEGHLSNARRHLTDKVNILSDRGGPSNENVIQCGESQKLHTKNRITEPTENNPEESTSLVPEYPWDTLVHQKAQDATVHLDNINHKELLEGPQSIHSTTVMSPVSNANKKLQEQRILTSSRQGQLQWQQTMYSERPLECPSSERKLKKCESTDSGYLSHSDSVDQQTWSSSPLHSLCEQNSETENEQNIRDSGASPPNTPQQAEKTSPFLLEKNQLEEHISKLISQNKAVVDNNQLANVRPRKTLLSKQGSIDLPMPYTFKDSFHFDIKSLGGSRKTNYPHCTAKSTFTPLEKSKPLFFHSVPTQFSTTVDCVAVTRSNSSPLVESTINLQEQSAKSKLSILQHQPLGAKFSSLLLGGQLTTNLIDSHNSHPRALVRQTAVEYTPSSQADDYSPTEGSKDYMRAREQRPTTKKGSRKKLKMFSQEKWQMYGDETFKKIYQKKNDDSAKKLRDQEEIHLNTLTNLVSNLHVEGNRSSFLQAANNRPLASYLGVSSVSTLQLDSFLHDHSFHDRKVASQQHDHISFLEPSEASKTSDDTPKIQRGKTVSVQGQNSLASVALGVNSGGSIKSVNCSRSKISQPQQMTGKPITIMSKPEDLIQPHLDLQSSNTSIMTKSCIPLMGHIRTAGCNTTICNKESQQHVQTIFRLGGRSSVDTIKDRGELPSERKKLKVEQLENRNNLPVNSSAINAEHEDLGDTATELDHYPVSDQSNPSDFHEEKLETIKSTATCPSGIASEKTVSSPSGLSSLETSRSSLDEAAPSLSVLRFKSQCPETTNEKEWMTEKHHAQSNSSDVRLLPCLMGKSHPSQELVCTSPISQQCFIQSAALSQGVFSPKYQLKLPVLEAMQVLPYTTGIEEVTANHSLADTITRDSPRLEARSHSAQPSLASIISGPLHRELTPLSGIEKPPTDATAEQTTFTIGFPSTSSAVSTVICMAYSGFGKSITWLNRSKGLCLQNKESVKMQSKNKSSTTNIDPSVQKSSMTPSCQSVDFSNCLLFANYEYQYKPVQHLPTGTFQVLATPAFGSGTPSSGNQEKPAEVWRTHTSCSSSLSGPPLNLGDSGSQFNISEGNGGKSYITTEVSGLQTLTMQERGASILQQKGLRSDSGSNKASVADVHYPSLTTEPNMTWCCLARNMPFVVQEKTDHYASCPSLHVCPEHLVAGRSDPSWRVPLLDTRNVSTLSATSSTTVTESDQVKEPLTLNQEEQHKRNAVTVTTSMKNSDFTAKKRALRENKQVLMKSIQVHKKLKITKKRGGLLPGHAHAKPNRMRKKQLLMSKVSFLPKKHRLPKKPHGLDGRQKSSHAGSYCSKSQKTVPPAEAVDNLMDLHAASKLPQHMNLGDKELSVHHHQHLHPSRIHRQQGRTPNGK